MTDTLTTSQRHLVMSHIRGKDTKPELLVRRWLWHHGYRYRLNVKGVPGKPDIVLRKYRTAIFVNGCFWHGHHLEIADSFFEQPRENEIIATPDQFKVLDSETLQFQNSECCKIPKTNTEFWKSKIFRNMERDRKNYQLLRDNGWQVLVVWECQLKPKLLEQTMERIEVKLQDYFLRTFGPKSLKYILLPDEDVPMAADAHVEYGANLDDIET